MTKRVDRLRTIVASLDAACAAAETLCMEAAIWPPLPGTTAWLQDVVKRAKALRDEVAETVSICDKTHTVEVPK